MQIIEKAVSRDELGKVDSAIWQDAEARDIALVGVPIAMQPSSFIRNNWKDKTIGLTSNVQLKALHNGEYIAFYLQWADASEDASTNDNDHFPDGAAIMFPLKGDAPLVTMGSPEQPVNVWHWAANRSEEINNNVAAGFGSSRVTSGVEITGSSRYQQGKWQAVFLRKLQQDAPEKAVEFVKNQSVNIAFAVWQGSNEERGGLKAFSPQWHSVTLA